MLQQIQNPNGTQSIAIILPDYSTIEDVAQLKSALFFALRRMADNLEMISPADMQEIITLLECMEVEK